MKRNPVDAEFDEHPQGNSDNPTWREVLLQPTSPFYTEATHMAARRQLYGQKARRRRNR